MVDGDECIGFDVWFDGRECHGGLVVAKGSVKAVHALGDYRSVLEMKRGYAYIVRGSVAEVADLVGCNEGC